MLLSDSSAGGWVVAARQRAYMTSQEEIIPDATIGGESAAAVGFSVEGPPQSSLLDQIKTPKGLLFSAVALWVLFR